MSPKIESLHTKTFAGRRFSHNQLSAIQQTVGTYTNLSLRELAHTVCEHHNWVTEKGTDKIQTCLNALEEMEAAGLFVLPEKQIQVKRKQKPIVQTHHTDAQPTIEGSLDQWTILTLRTAIQREDIKRWNEFVDRYHYLGYKRPIGTHLRYFIVGEKRDGDEQILGCLLFSFATRSLACRDQWIGWDEKARQRRLNLVLNNNRFLILPWVTVKNLASKVLSIVTAQVADDWMVQHNFRPVLLETFVDPDKFTGTCYKAANWQLIGQSHGRKGSARVARISPKDVYVYPLAAGYQVQLNEGIRPRINRNRKNKAPKVFSPSALAADDPFIMLWQRIMHIVQAVTGDFDQQWQIRRRIIDTKLLILVIFRLVLSKNQQGYGATLVELWDQCRLMNISLSTPKPVAQSSLSSARKKLDENIFKRLNSKIIEAYETDAEAQRWLGHRLFAVDGTKINVPRQLLDKPFKLPSDNAYYPQALVSCLYQLRSKIPYDFDMVSHKDERASAIVHLKVLGPQDLVIYDRGYYGYGMLYYHFQAGIDFVFRVPNKGGVIDEFFSGDETDRTVSLVVQQRNQESVRRLYPEVKQFKPLQVRLVKYIYDDTTYVLATSLLDVKKYSIKALSDLYHSRWGIEELYKISKQLIEVGEFHAQSERGVKQELFAHFVLMTMNRIFANHADSELNQGEGILSENSTVSSAPLFRVNMKNALLMMTRSLESLLLAQRTVIADTLNKVIDGIMTCRQKERPGRKYPRVSRKPDTKWRPPKKRGVVSAVGV